MRGITVILPLSFFALGQVEERRVNHKEDVVVGKLGKTVVEVLVCRLLDRALKAVHDAGQRMFPVCSSFTSTPITRSCRVLRLPSRSMLHRKNPTLTDFSSTPGAKAQSRSEVIQAESENHFSALEEMIGVERGPVVFGNGSRGRGVFAARAFDAFDKDLVFGVPLAGAEGQSLGGTALCVATEGSEQAAFLAANVLHRIAGLPEPLATFAARTDVPAPVRLAVLTHWELQEGLRGSLYGAMLPTEDEYTTALFLAPEALAEFQDAKLERLVMEAKAKAKSWYAELVVGDPLLKAEPRLVPELPDFLLALTHVQSRAFFGLIGNGTVEIMVPFCDLLNHDFNPCCNYDFVPEAMYFMLYTRRNVCVGEELCITYGEDLDNYELQVTYGFTVPGNPNDRIDLQYDLGQQGDASASEMRMDAEHIQKAAEQLIATGLKSESVQRRMAAARATLKRARWPGILSPAEAAAAAASACQVRLDCFATTISDDKALLRRDGLSPPFAAAVRFRLERKLLLRTVLELAIAVQALSIEQPSTGSAHGSVQHLSHNFISRSIAL